MTITLLNFYYTLSKPNRFSWFHIVTYFSDVLTTFFTTCASKKFIAIYWQNTIVHIELPLGDEVTMKALAFGPSTPAIALSLFYDMHNYSLLQILTPSSFHGSWNVFLLCNICLRIPALYPESFSDSCLWVDWVEISARSASLVTNSL